jgi:hypothetical protein
MIASASDKVAKSLRALAIWNVTIAPLVFANLILLSVRIDRFIHPERLPLQKRHPARRPANHQIGNGGQGRNRTIDTRIAKTGRRDLSAEDMRMCSVEIDRSMDSIKAPDL